jgi:hypothetical protein
MSAMSALCQTEISAIPFALVYSARFCLFMGARMKSFPSLTQSSISPLSVVLLPVKYPNDLLASSLETQHSSARLSLKEDFKIPRNGTIERWTIGCHYDILRSNSIQPMHGCVFSLSFSMIIGRGHVPQ